MARKPILRVRYAASAQADLLAIWDWNREERGERGAEAYIDFLLKRVSDLAKAPERGLAIEEYPGLRRLVLRKRAKGQGHVVVYRVVEDVVEILHIYHTAQDWRGRLGSLLNI